ncbi:MAG: GAF domain-containing protein [Anaerolineales bacterium]
MLNWLRNIFSSENDQDPSFITLVRTVLIIATVGSTALAFSQSLAVREPNDWATVYAIAIITLISGTSLFFSYRNILWPGKLLFPTLTLIAVTFIAINAKGLHDSAIVGFPIVIIFASLLLGQKAISLATTFTILAVWTVAYFDFSGLNSTNFAKTTGLDDVIAITILQIAAAGSLNSLMHRLNRAVDVAKTNEQAQIEANQELRELHSTLEERISERTSEVSQRAIQFQAIAEISKVIIDARGELKDLLPRIANVIGEQFNFYHVGIYLLDNRKEYAHLQATNSEGGRKLMAQRFNLPVNRESVVGSVASNGNLRIVLDHGEDTTPFNYLELPGTRSEIAVPLRSGVQIIGVLDIHSQAQSAFGGAEAEVLSVLADQVTIAIEVARQFEETQRSLKETERIYQQYVRQEYSQLIKTRTERGFIYRDAEVKSLEKPLQAPEILEAIKSGDLQVADNPQGTKLAVPIKLRGHVIGTLNVGTNGNNKPTSENIEIITAVADRLAIALENVRLLDAAQRRAVREHAIGEISASVSSSTNMEEILRSAVLELGRRIGGADVVLELGADPGVENMLADTSGGIRKNIGNGKDEEPE